ncbi:hypothetical protein BSL78_24956 [Apostichopus japonicus]|uniref:LRAT domain-containing protein n=1 Tax=Stichopus japonicus TaxID=307972 RepID=A0A2G8JR50_STIJA|nr:hypothetical protein BSL78_24956 [Apostichopus japonicus]
MDLAAKIGDISETLLLTPRGKVTLIEKKDLRRLDLRVFDRIALHRSYMMIHEAIVLQVNGPCEIVVLERTKEDGPVSKGTVRAHTINLYFEEGQLYRYDDRPTKADMPEILKRVLEYNGTEGYNMLSYNCQHLASSIRHGNEDSHQTWWMILKIVVDCCSHIGISFIAEKYEEVHGGKNNIGATASACLHLALFVAECVVALIKVFRGRMSWKDFFNVMTRQLPMHLFGSAGNSIQPILKKHASKFLSEYTMAAFGKLIAFEAVVLVFGFCGCLVPDAILPRSAPSGYYKYVRQVLVIAASVGSFFAGIAVEGWLLEAFVAMIIGCRLTLIGHYLFHGRFLSWWPKEDVSGRSIPGESNAVSVDSVFDSIQSDESLSEEERKRLIDKFKELKSQMPTFYTGDDVTIQDLTRHEHEASATRQRVRNAAPKTILRVRYDDIIVDWNGITRYFDDYHQQYIISSDDMMYCFD